MDLQTYLKKRKEQGEDELKPPCSRCLQPEVGCYCHLLAPLDPGISFVILIHPIEVRRRIATGRMTYLSLQGSYLISGQDFSMNEQVNALIAHPDHHCVILYPGPHSLDISKGSIGGEGTWIPKGKRLVVFVIDGTWATAKKMMRESKNLQDLPQIGFTPQKPSAFIVRKQPAENCYSTIEAVHQTIELLGAVVGYDVDSRAHDSLLQVFSSMVQRQLRHQQQAAELRGPYNSRDLRRQSQL